MVSIENGIVLSHKKSKPFAFLSVSVSLFLKSCGFPFCHLEKKLDLASVDLWKMRVAELKQILYSWGEECRACAEKADYVNLIRELAPKYVATHRKTEL